MPGTFSVESILAFYWAVMSSYVQIIFQAPMAWWPERQAVYVYAPQLRAIFQVNLLNLLHNVTQCSFPWRTTTMLVLVMEELVNDSSSLPPSLPPFLPTLTLECAPPTAPLRHILPESGWRHQGLPSEPGSRHQHVGSQGEDREKEPGRNGDPLPANAGHHPTVYL